MGSFEPLVQRVVFVIQQAQCGAPHWALESITEQNLSGGVRILPFNTAYVLFCLEPGGHQLVAAAHAFQTEICTGSEHEPSFFPAGVGFFHD